MFETLSRSWELAKLSYSILWQNKKLVIFPLVSGIATLVVMISFLMPLWATGTLESWQASLDQEQPGEQNVAMYVVLFVFYFVNYFLIVFFNSGLIACTMQALRGEQPDIGAGLSAAMRRLPQIFGWALLSACVGVLLRMIENSHKRAAQILAAILGTAWTAMTYFVVPAIVMEGLGPLASIKASLANLRKIWGEALVSNFSIGFITFLIGLPVILLGGFLAYLGIQSGSSVGMVLGVSAAVILLVLLALASSAADTILKGLLYSYATGRDVPTDIDTAQLQDAFVHRDQR